MRCDLTKKRDPPYKNNCKVLERRKRRTKKIQKRVVVSSLKVDKILCAPAKTHSRGTERTIKMDGARFLSFFLRSFTQFLSLSLSLLMIYFRLCFASR